MKVEQQKPEFEPIVITLETEHEARVLKTLVGSVTGSSIFRDTTSELFNELSQKGIDQYPDKFGSDSGAINSESLNLGRNNV
jgi:hypothetical protein